MNVNGSSESWVYTYTYTVRSGVYGCAITRAYNTRDNVTRQQDRTISVCAVMCVIGIERARSRFLTPSHISTDDDQFQSDTTNITHLSQTFYPWGGSFAIALLYICSSTHTYIYTYI